MTQFKFISFSFLALIVVSVLIPWIEVPYIGNIAGYNIGYGQTILIITIVTAIFTLAIANKRPVSILNTISSAIVALIIAYYLSDLKNAIEISGRLSNNLLGKDIFSGTLLIKPGIYLCLLSSISSVLFNIYHCAADREREINEEMPVYEQGDMPISDNIVAQKEQQRNNNLLVAFIVVVGILACALFLSNLSGEPQPQHENLPVTIDTVNPETVRYIVVEPKAYFHDAPNRNAKRKAYLIEGQTIVAEKEYNGYIYCLYTNSKGTITKGWISISNIATQ